MPTSTPPSIARYGDLMRSGELTSTGLIQSVLDRIAETEPLVSAYAFVDRSGALAAAHRADDELRHGTDRGPLHGIPIAIKDVIATADMPTLAGSRVPLGALTEADATVVGLLRAAGAVILGKHVTHEFACGQNVPPTRNAWDHDCYPGGSSAGAGVSVAVGSCVAAIGTDAGGSVRKPAALNGVVGLKPTYGRVSRAGVIQPSGSMDHVGLVTRYVADAAVILQAIAGAVPGDPSTIAEPVPHFGAYLSEPVAGRRVGVVSRSFLGGDDPAVTAATQAALTVLGGLGADLIEVDMPSLPLVDATTSVILAAEAGYSHLALLRAYAASYGPATRRYLQLGALVPAPFLQAAYKARATIARDVSHVFDTEGVDVLVTPTTPLRALPLAEMSIERDLVRYVRHTALANLTGRPAVTVPCGFGDGLPIGLQLMGRPFREAELLGMAAAYEAAAPWAAATPAISS
jgi:Asp-tRNA(Asn)/Glu-tRNA(Gln) amidotransferase A subunit family amidase